MLDIVPSGKLEYRSYDNGSIEVEVPDSGNISWPKLAHTVERQ